MAFIAAKANDLRIGLYIKIVGSWFSHPFPSNTFKITSAKELAILRSLKNFQILYAPGLSDPDPHQHLAPEEEGAQASQDQHSPAIPPTLADTPDEAAVLREVRVQAFKHRRQKLIETEQAYQQFVAENKALTREVLNGYVKGMRKAEAMIDGLSGVLVDDGTLVTLMNLGGNMEAGNDSYYHSLNTAILSMVVARGLELSKEAVHMIGLAGLFHDLGETASKESGPPHTHLQAIRKHPEMGKTMIAKGFSVPESSLVAIHQHHERLNGSGYPQGLKDDAIHQFAKILMVVDAYDDLCNNPDLEKSLTPFEAISALYTKCNSEFCGDAVSTLIHHLGVYPPSSIVELSDESIGVVCTTNVEDSLRPLVMLYAPEIPREEAIILDLAQETQLSIKKSRRPKELPREVWDYLNPRCMIQYFPVSGAQNSPSASSPAALLEPATRT